jgi:hypothetical protein
MCADHKCYDGKEKKQTKETTLKIHKLGGSSLFALGGPKISKRIA